MVVVYAIVGCSSDVGRCGAKVERTNRRGESTMMGLREIRTRGEGENRDDDARRIIKNGKEGGKVKKRKVNK